MKLNGLKFIGIFCFLFVSRVLCAQLLFPQDSLVADFREFVHDLEETHPDPYSGFGGKIFFHKAAAAMEAHLQQKESSLEDFQRLLTQFIAPLEDGHTQIYEVASGPASGTVFPLNAKVIPGAIILTGILDSLEYLLGSSLLKVNGIGLDELILRVGEKWPAENLYHRYFYLARNIGDVKFWERFFPGKNQISFTLLTPENVERVLEMRPVSADSVKQMRYAHCPQWEKTKNMKYLDYRFLNKKSAVMYFRLESVMAREAFDFMRKNEWSSLQPMLRQMYQGIMRKQMPENVGEAIAGIPDIASVFREMLEKMKESHSRILIIDLRGNGGGFTPIMLPTLYQLFGDRYLKTPMGIANYRLISPLFMKKMNQTLDDFNQQYHTNFAYGDYIFDEDYEEKSDPETLRNNFYKECMGDAAVYIRDQEGKPVYTPEKIFVLTDVNTFSAAFHYAFYLWKMGAVVVGVPSRQAPNCFMEMTPFRLSRTGLEGSISNSAQYYLPPADERAKIFYPSVRMTYKDYQKYNFDKEAELLYLLDYLEE